MRYGSPLALIGLVLLLGCQQQVPSEGPRPAMPRTSAAPDGSPGQVAMAAIRYAEHPCPRIRRAHRRPSDGSILATCSNGERYWVLRIETVVAAMRCSALAALTGRTCPRT